MSKHRQQHSPGSHRVVFVENRVFSCAFNNHFHPRRQREFLDEIPAPLAFEHAIDRSPDPAWRESPTPQKDAGKSGWFFDQGDQEVWSVNDRVQMPLRFPIRDPHRVANVVRVAFESRGCF